MKQLLNGMPRRLADIRAVPVADAMRVAASALTFASGLFVVATTLRMVASVWQPLPFWDQWDELISGRHLTWSWLISQHNEHRIALPRLVFMADWWLARETNRVDFGANVAIQAALTLLILRIAHGAGIRGRASRVWAAGVCFTLLWWNCQYENFGWGFQVQFYGVVMAAAAAFAQLALYRPTIWNIARVAALETIATYTLASGILAAFVNVGLAAILHRSRRLAAGLAVACAALLAIYLRGYVTPSAHSNPLDAGRHLPGIVAFTCVELGGPLAGGIEWLRRMAPDAPTAWHLSGVIGGVGIGMFLWQLWRLLRQRGPRSPHRAALLALCAFVVLMCLVTGVGRLRFGLDEAMSSRYATPTLAFWTSIVLLLAADLARDGQVPATIAMMAVPLAALAAASQPHYEAIASHRSQSIAAAIPAVLADVADQQLLAAVYPAPQAVLQRRAILRAAGTSVFSEPWSDWLGTPLADHVARVDRTVCGGALGLVSQVSETPAIGWRAVGEAWTMPARGAVRKLVLADGTGVVVGYGIGALDLQAIGINDPSHRAMPGTGWVGEFSQAPPQSVVAYALVESDRIACPLPGQRQVQLSVSIAGHRPPGMGPGGFVDSVTVAGGVVEARGWGLLQAQAPWRIFLDTNLPVSSTSVALNPRPDVAAALHNPRLANSGFTVILTLTPGAVPPRNIHLCVWTEDAELGRHLLTIPSRPDLCSAADR